MSEKTIIPVRFESEVAPLDIANSPGTIDIRGFFPTEDETRNNTEVSRLDKRTGIFADIRYVESDRAEPLLPEVVVSQSSVSEKRRKAYLKFKRKARERSLALRYWMSRMLLSIRKKILVFLIERHQKAEQKLRAKEWGGINFDKKYDEKSIFFLAVSLPETVGENDVESVMMFYPIISRKVAYQMLKIRKDQFASWKRLFTKENVLGANRT